MIVEKLSAHSHSHGHHSYSHKDTDTESLIESSPKHHHHGHNHGNIGSGGDILSFMIGLLTHSAVDGIALGAVSSEGNATSLSLLVFIALMAHKGPAAISMTAFLKRKLSATLAITQDGKIKREIIKQLLFFSGAAPIAAILTYLILNSISYFMENDSMDNESGEIDELGNETQLLGSCLLFSGGTFLYVVTLHIIPEIKEWRNSHNESDDSHANLSWFDLVILTVGCIVPSLFEHSH